MFHTILGIFKDNIFPNPQYEFQTHSKTIKCQKVII